jgi:glutamate racemase
MLEKNIDTVVLGCTHYPFVIPLVEQVVGENVRVIDPAPSVARQVKRLLEAGGLLNSSGVSGKIQIHTSGDVKMVESVLPKLLNEAASVKSVTWKNDREIQ